METLQKAKWIGQCKICKTIFRTDNLAELKFGLFDIVYSKSNCSECQTNYMDVMFYEESSKFGQNLVSLSTRK